MPCVRGSGWNVETYCRREVGGAVGHSRDGPKSLPATSQRTGFNFTLKVKTKFGNRGQVKWERNSGTERRLLFQKGGFWLNRNLQRDDFVTRHQKRNVILGGETGRAPPSRIIEKKEESPKHALGQCFTKMGVQEIKRGRGTDRNRNRQKNRIAGKCTSDIKVKKGINCRNNKRTSSGGSASGSHSNWDRGRYWIKSRT